MILLALLVVSILIALVGVVANDRDIFPITIIAAILIVVIGVLGIMVALNLGMNLVDLSNQIYIANTTYQQLQHSDNVNAIIEFNSKVLAAQQFHSIWWRHIFCSDAYYGFELLPLPQGD